MGELEQSRQTLQETMNFMGALASGIEQFIGRAANGMAFVAGKSLGKRFSANAPRVDDVEQALDEVRKVLQANNCLWNFETFKRKAAPSLVTQGEEGQQIQLVFRDCMIRQSLFRFGHHQKGSLCYMMYGFFSGALEAIMGKKSDLTIDHAGENACLKTLTIRG